MSMTRTTQAQVSVISDAETLSKLQAISDHIALFLCRKAMVEYRRQDLTNPTLLDKVKFWFQIDPRNGSTILCYDSHPSTWNIDAILKAITDLEHIFYTQDTGGNTIYWKGID